MSYIKVSEAAEKWGISPRRVRILCAEGKIPDVIRKGKFYLIPENAVKPADGRLSGTAILSDPSAPADHLSKCRTLIKDEAGRLRKENLSEFPNNSDEQEKIN